MEDILFFIDRSASFQPNQRGLAAAGSQVVANWKLALWERNSVEPAMLRVPIVVLVFTILWGINLFVMEKVRIQYHTTIAVKSAPIGFVFWTAIALFAIYALTMNIVSSWGGYPVEIGISVFYITILVFSFLPSIPGNENRSSFYRLFRIIFSPGTAITFPEVLLADAFTSVSKVLKDFGVTAVAVYAYYTNTRLIDLHDESMLLIAILASLPFLIRVRQCWIQFDNAPDALAKFPIMLNMVKYGSGFPPIWIAAAASLGYFHPKLPAITAAFATVNSLFSFGWDVVMDWGLMSFSRSGLPYCRKRFFYPYISYPVIAIFNLCLRFSWAANRIPFFATMQPSHLVLLVEVAEVFRRFLWNFYRIEWEVIVQHERLLTANGDRDQADEKLLKSGKSSSSSNLMEL